MKRALLAASLVGCASGSAALSQDAPLGGNDDAKVWLDGHIEGTPDAPVDAAPHIDAPIDAHPDARPIDAPPDACVPQTTELLLNPVLDLTPAGIDWVQVPIDPTYPPITSDGQFAAHTAPYKAWMGGITGDDEGVASVTDVIYQDVMVPAGTTQLVLTGYYVVGTNETTTTAANDTGHVDLLQTNGTPIENVMSLSNLTNTGTSWLFFTHTFTAIPSGQTVRLRITSTNNQTLGTNFFFDTLSLKATHCP